MADQVHESRLLEIRVVVFGNAMRKVFVSELTRVQSPFAKLSPARPGIDFEGAIDVESVVKCSRLPVRSRGLLAVDVLDGDACLASVKAVQGMDKEEEQIFAVREKLVMTTVIPCKMLSGHENALALVEVSKTCVRSEFFPSVG